GCPGCQLDGHLRHVHLLVAVQTHGGIVRPVHGHLPDPSVGGAVHEDVGQHVARRDLTAAGEGGREGGGVRGCAGGDVHRRRQLPDAVGAAHPALHRGGVVQVVTHLRGARVVEIHPHDGRSVPLA